MSQENVELVRQGLEAFFDGDLERAMSIVHPDVVAVRAPPLPRSSPVLLVSPVPVVALRDSELTAGVARSARRRSLPVGGAFESLGGGSIRLVGRDAAGGARGRCRKSRFGEQSAQRSPDLSRWCVRGESDPGFEPLDAACVERLVASERQQ
jgi:hypothetical protein